MGCADLDGSVTDALVPTTSIPIAANESATRCPIRPRMPTITATPPSNVTCSRGCMPPSGMPGRGSPRRVQMPLSKNRTDITRESE